MEDAVLNTGHRHPKIIAAAKAQEERFTHAAFQVMVYGSYVERAERLNKAGLFDGSDSSSRLTKTRC